MKDRWAMRRPRENDEGWTDLKVRTLQDYPGIYLQLSQHVDQHIIEILRWERVRTL
jgi:hypothetical protein